VRNTASPGAGAEAPITYSEASGASLAVVVVGAGGVCESAVIGSSGSKLRGIVIESDARELSSGSRASSWRGIERTSTWTRASTSLMSSGLIR
jgi:hypothetical protein